ncbi:MAG: hypothetical protein QW578_02660 [Thermoplasmatales archaeon]
MTKKELPEDPHPQENGTKQKQDNNENEVKNISVDSSDEDP